jgi:steroid delta-isomerase-like uncharacterized protein
MRMTTRELTTNKNINERRTKMNTVVNEKATSAIEQNKVLLRKAVEDIWNKGNFDNIREMASEDFVIHFPREEIRGLESIKEFYTELRNAFPDIRFTIIDQVAEEDKVVTHWTAAGTHKGELKGIPPTGKKVKFSAIDIDRISHGKFVECWSNMDELGLMQQLGVIEGK